MMRGKTITVTRQQAADAAVPTPASVPELTALKQDLAAVREQMAEIRKEQLRNTWAIVAVAVTALGALIIAFVT